MQTTPRPLPFLAPSLLLLLSLGISACSSPSLDSANTGKTFIVGFSSNEHQGNDTCNTSVNGCYGLVADLGDNTTSESVVIFD